MLQPNYVATSSSKLKINAPVTDVNRCLGVVFFRAVCPHGSNSGLAAVEKLCLWSLDGVGIGDVPQK